MNNSNEEKKGIKKIKEAFDRKNSPLVTSTSVTSTSNLGTQAWVGTIVTGGSGGSASSSGGLGKQFQTTNLGCVHTWQSAGIRDKTGVCSQVVLYCTKCADIKLQNIPTYNSIYNNNVQF